MGAYADETVALSLYRETKAAIGVVRYAGALTLNVFQKKGRDPLSQKPARRHLTDDTRSSGSCRGRVVWSTRAWVGPVRVGGAAPVLLHGSVLLVCPSDVVV